MRPELLALTPDSLAALTNRGLVKRATRELDRAAPTLKELDGVVEAVFPDGITTTLPAGGLDAGTCTCGAAGACRHVLGLVLAYQAVEGRTGAPTADAASSPSSASPSETRSGTRELAGVNAAETNPSGEESATADPATADPATAGSATAGSATAGSATAGSATAGSATVDPVAAGPAGVSPGAAAERGAGIAGKKKVSADNKFDPGKPLPAEAEPARDKAGQAPPGQPETTSGHHIAWSPGDFTDAEIEAAVGKRMMVAARRAHATGYVARVRRGTAEDPVPGVDLPAATVRFHAAGNLGFARSDAAAGARDDVIALAIWAFRVADAQDPQATDLHVQVGGGNAGDGGAALEAAVALASTVLLEGAVNLENGLATRTTTVRSALETARLRWPLLALDDLQAQLTAYRDRSARYRPDALADHVAELFARHRAVTNGGAGLRSRVLGTDEASETPLRQARLDGLGARVTAVGGERVVEVFLAHADSASVLVLRKVYETDHTGSELGARRVAGSTVRRLAGGSVITDAAHRSASRTVRIGQRGLSRTQAMEVSRPWRDLPAGILAPSLKQLAQELDELPPRPVRARVEAELVRVIPVAGVERLVYSPGDQRLDAVIVDAEGTSAIVSATHAGCAPGRLDAMAAALTGAVTHVSGPVSRRGGTIVVDPIAFVLENPDSIVVPDLTRPSHLENPGGSGPATTNVLKHMIEETRTLLAEVAHRGLHHLPSSTAARLRQTGTDLRRAGLHRIGDEITALAGLLGPDPGEEAVRCWVNAYLRVSLAADLGV